MLNSSVGRGQCCLKDEFSFEEGRDDQPVLPEEIKAGPADPTAVSYVSLYQD